MGKSILFLATIFFSLVAFNWLFAMADSLLPANSGTITASAFIHSTEAWTGPSSTGAPVVLHVSLFSPDGAGTSYMTQGYGRTPYSSIYPDDWHDGIDIGAAYDTPIYSPSTGTVLATGNQDNFCYHDAFGKYIAIEDPTNGLVLWYAHLGTIDVKPGEAITKSMVLGTVGATGLETGTHLHFSIFEAYGFSMTSRDGCGPEPTGQDVNPLNYLGTTYQ